MSLAQTDWHPQAAADRPFELSVPDSLKQQLFEYRRRVWTIKLLEASAVALVALGIGFLTVLGMDRLGDTPGWLRGLIWLAVGCGIAVVPWFAYRWIWCRRELKQLARLLSHKLPSVGDSLLGVLELAESHAEQSRSPALVQAAIRQVATDAQQRDLNTALPPARHRMWAGAASILVVFCGVIAAWIPGAASSALQRLAFPFGDAPRFTFTRLEALPVEWFVPHGEPVPVSLQLLADSEWSPQAARLQVGSQQPVDAQQVEGLYSFVLPPQIDRQPLWVNAGDYKQKIQLVPTPRPELESLVGTVTLPEYLSLSQPLEKDARGGSIGLVKGSRVAFTATANRPLENALVNGSQATVVENRLTTATIDVNESTVQELVWEDQFQLAGREPFRLSINALDDEPPTMVIEGLPRSAVVLDSELLTFTVRAGDDFGVQRVGLMWRGLPNSVISNPASGERVLSGGAPDADTLDLQGTFSATSYGIEPQPIELFVWAEDYLPGRQRVMSPPYNLYVLTADQHAIWMTEQLSKWHRQALEVRDREMQLYETNKELRDLSNDQLGTAEMRERIQRQASAETANGRRLTKLADMGDELLRAASRNSEIGVGHLETWAEMLQVLKDVSQNRMPNVADLLKEAAVASPQVADKPSGEQPPMAGNIQATPNGSQPATENKDDKIVKAPAVVDTESSQNSPDDQPIEPGPAKEPSTGSLRLPTTTVMGKPQASDQEDKPKEKVEAAVDAQEELLAEFDKIAEELNTVLANLEGSTLVKRLKAASRTQALVAKNIAGQLEDTFGKRNMSGAQEAADVLQEMAKTEEDSIQDISFIMDDMAAYFERRRFAQFKMVLDDMKQSDVIGGLRQLTDEIPREQGLSVAQCEYWSDALDRWAEDLVDPACNGQCPGGKSPDSLPPSIVLEVLQILEAEVNLREETRVAEQSRAAIETDKFQEEALRLSQAQNALQDRIVAVGERIAALPNSAEQFGKELELMAAVDGVMGEAVEILAQPHTGDQAVAAETEAIELLLQSKRINPKSGGGGGSAPGGGGGGTTADSALALLGSGVNQKEIREDRAIQQTTGETGTVLPEEFRSGLDEYFNRLERMNP
jgi:hypothetical protein